MIFELGNISHRNAIFIIFKKAFSALKFNFVPLYKK